MSTRYMTTAEVAEQLGVTRRRVHQIAADRGIEGRLFGQTKVWTAAEVAILSRRRPPGRPKQRASA